MWKLAVTGVALCLLAVPQLAHAQNVSPVGSPQLLSDADLQSVTNRRIEVVKLALALTPEQEKYWPAVEDAIRARAMARHQRLAKLAVRLNSQQESDPVELLRERADILAQRAAGLKSLPMPGSRSTRVSTLIRSSGCASSLYTCFVKCEMH